MVEGARLESVCRGNSTEGSNPSLRQYLQIYSVNSSIQKYILSANFQPLMTGSDGSLMDRCTQNSGATHDTIRLPADPCAAD